jgi:hypothetical protein
MYRSTYHSWFRRLLILGAVVAGLTASAAGARVDPGTPPDVRDVASALKAAAPDVFEREAAAHPYGRGLASATSPIDRIIAQEQGRQHDLALFSLGFSAPTTSSDFLSTPPDVQDAMTALHSTPEGLKADGLRYQGIARVYEQLQSSGGSDFAWDDWAIGVGAGVGLALLLGIGLIVGRQQRHRVQPA